jgi:5-methylcytosine-specific restriction endonuclease McrA
VRRHHRHLLRTAALAVAASAGWWQLGRPDGPGGLGYAELAAVIVIPLAARAATFVTGPAWWAALVTARVRATWRHQRRLRGLGRPHIPVRLRRWVYAADRYRCVRCGYRSGTPCGHQAGPLGACGKVHPLQLEHIKPFSRGGLTSLLNLVTLCPHCNVAKSDYWVYRGRAYYHGFEGASDELEAAAVLAAGRLARRSPARLGRLWLAHLAG